MKDNNIERLIGNMMVRAEQVITIAEDLEESMYELDECILDNFGEIPDKLLADYADEQGPYKDFCGYKASRATEKAAELFKSFSKYSLPLLLKLIYEKKLAAQKGANYDENR